MVWRMHIRYGVMALAAALLAHTACAMANPESSERQYKLEAAFLYNFFNYVTWPGYSAPSELRDVTICVAGRDPILRYLSYVQERMADERQITVKEWQEGQSLDACHILYSRNGNIPALENATLTVSTQSQFIKRGGMIGISEVDGRMGISVNNNAMNRNGFQVSSRLLRIAQEVK